MIDYSLIAGVYKKTIQSLILVKVLNSEAISFIITDCETCMSIESKNKISWISSIPLQNKEKSTCEKIREYTYLFRDISDSIYEIFQSMVQAK